MVDTIPKKKPKKRQNEDEEVDYTKMSTDDFIFEIKRLKAHNKQLKVLLEQATSNKNGEKQTYYGNRPFNAEKYHKRHVLLKFAYLGWDYDGFTTQEGANNTVERYLFEALVKTKLIESRETSNYHRCGRTDKGVSAFSQVISIDLRSNCSSGIGVIKNDQSKIINDDISNEINYVKLLNGVFPQNIRALSWCPVSENISSRFDCTSRSYRYYFPKGDLRIDLMNEAGQKLIGEHDFRNFCKMDIANGVLTFFRRIDRITFNVLDSIETTYTMCEMIIDASSFLWHQIRCIIALLILVGQEKEKPSLIEELLDVSKWPAKPQYNIGSELPLILFDSKYDNVEWICNKIELEKTIKHFQNIWLENETKSTMIKRILDSLEDEFEIMGGEGDQFKGSNARKINQPYIRLLGKSVMVDYIPLEKRKTAKSLENRVEHYVKRKKLDTEFVKEKLNLD